MREPTWRTYNWLKAMCPDCGADVEVFTKSDRGRVYHGEQARCTSRPCPQTGRIDFDVDGDRLFAFVIWQ